MPDVVSINQTKDRLSNTQHFDKITAETEDVFTHIENMKNAQDYLLEKTLEVSGTDDTIEALKKIRSGLIKSLSQLKGLI